MAITKTIKIFMLLGLVVVFTLAGCKDTSTEPAAGDFEIDKQYTRGPFTVKVRVDTAKITIARTVTVELEAAVAAGFEVVMPKVPEVLEDFDVRDRRDHADRLDENNNVVKTDNWRLEPLSVGKLKLPAFVFEFYEKQTTGPDEPKQYSIETEPVEIEVASVLGDQQGQVEIADIEDVLDMPFRLSRWWVVVLCVAGLIIVLVILRLVKRSRLVEEVRVFRSAHEVAYQRLRVLMAEKLVEKGSVKQFYGRVSNILRHYIEDRFDLRAPERTTEEFLFELQQDGSRELSYGDKDDLSEFLRHCDLVKFARHQPTGEQIQKTFDLVESFIEKTKSDEHKIDVTDSSEPQTEAA